MKTSLYDKKISNFKPRFLNTLLFLMFAALCSVSKAESVDNKNTETNENKKETMQSDGLKNISPANTTNLFKKNISFEWDPVSDASYYDVELTPEPANDGRPVLSFKSPENKWSGDIIPGGYSLRTRSRDKRNVPGEWSTPQSFVLNLDDLKMTNPTDGKNINSDNATENLTTLTWNPVPGAVRYQIILKNEDNTVSLEQNIPTSKFTIKLPVAKKYFYTVTPYTALGISSEKPTTGSFILFGKKIATPKITIPDSAWVRQLTWFNSANTEEFIFILSKWNTKNNKWDVISKETNYKKNQISFLQEWPGGRYKLQVQAKSKFRVTSDISTAQFSVFDGNRNPSNEYKYTIRQSIDRTSGYFGVLSYLITMMDYTGTNQDRGGATATFNALGGTGRFGGGYLSANQPWGFLGVMDLSGFIIDSRNLTFMSAELNAVYRAKTGDRSEIRHQAGLFYKELPEVIGNALGEFESTETIASVGPHYGIEYWYALTPRLGFQLNFHAYLSQFKLKTPTGENVTSTLSYQMGAMGSYKLSKKITGLMGYAYRNDSLAYQSQRFSGEKNSVDLKGHYLNLFLEWSF